MRLLQWLRLLTLISVIGVQLLATAAVCSCIEGLPPCFMCTDQHVKYWMPRKFLLTSSLLLNYRFKSDVCSPKKHCFSRLNIFILRFFFCYRMAVLVLSFLIQTLYHLVTTILCDTEKLLFMMVAPKYQPYILTLN